MLRLMTFLNRAWIVGNYSKHDKIASTEWIVFQKNNLIIPKFLQYFSQMSVYEITFPTMRRAWGGR